MTATDQVPTEFKARLAGHLANADPQAAGRWYRADDEWIESRLNLPEDEDWYESSSLTVEELPAFELHSVLFALEHLGGVVERAAFVGDAPVLRAPIASIEVPVSDTQTLEVAGPLTRHLVEHDGERVVVWAEAGRDLTRLLAVSAHEEVRKAILSEVLQRVAGEASAWRRRPVLFEPGTSIGYRHLPPVGECPVLSADLERELRHNLIVPILHHDSIGSVVPRRGVLLYGPPGTGKTWALRAVRHAVDGRATVIVATPKCLLDPSMIGTLFEMAGSAAPAMIVLEDLDIIVGDRDRSLAAHSLGELLARLDGPSSVDGVFVAATTNDVHALDHALSKRPGRFDRRIEVGPASSSVRRVVVEQIAARHGLEASAVDEVVARTDGWTVAELRELERLALVASIDAKSPFDLGDAVPYVHRSGSASVVGFRAPTGDRGAR